MTSIAHYRIVSKLGEGGMGAVYRATDTKLNRDVAIKVLPDSFAADPDRLARFTREAQLLAALNHPNIASLYGVEDGALIMELVDGQPLKGPVPVETALEYAAQIASALEYAHEKGIVHRDLKPANILVTADGVVKVLDFGLAKALSSDAPAADPMSSPTLTMNATQVGVIMGTAAYMSPEQAKGKPADRRADIWSFGVVLWEMLTGRALFEGETVSDVMAQVLTREPDLTPIPPQFRKLLYHCLQKDPRQRLRSIGDWRLLIEEPPRIAAVPARPSPLPWTVAAVLAIALVAAGWALFRRGPQAAAAPVLRVSIAPESGSTLLLDATSGTQQISPDGRMLAYIASLNGARHIWVRPLDVFTARQYAGTEFAEGVFWSPDSKLLGFMTSSGIKILDIATATVKELCSSTGGVRGASWNATGTILFGTTTGGLMSVTADGGKPTLASVYDRRRGSSQYWPQFLPDGRRFLYWLRGLQPELSGIYAGSLDVPPEKQIQRQILATTNPFLYVDGYLLFSRGRTLFAQHLNLDRLVLEGNPIPITEFASQRDWVSASQTGILATSATGLNTRTVTIVGRDGKTLDVIGSADAYLSLRVAPGGRSIALVRTDVEAVSLNIWLMDFARGVPTRFTTAGSVAAFPVWSPDGREIAYESFGGNPSQTRRKSLSANGADEAIQNAESGAFPSDWSRDGKNLAVSTNAHNGESTLAILPLAAGAKPVTIANSNGVLGTPRFSPSGRWVAFSSEETGTSEVYVQEVPGLSKDPAPKVRISRSGGFNPAWNSDGSELYFNTPDDRLMAASVKTSSSRFEAAEPEQLFTIGGAAGYNGAVYWDPIGKGDRFAILRAAPVDPKDNRINLLINWKPK